MGVKRKGVGEEVTGTVVKWRWRCAWVGDALWRLSGEVVAWWRFEDEMVRALGIGERDIGEVRRKEEEGERAGRRVVVERWGEELRW